MLRLCCSDMTHTATVPQLCHTRYTKFGCRATALLHQLDNLGWTLCIQLRSPISGLQWHNHVLGQAGAYAVRL